MPAARNTISTSSHHVRSVFENCGVIAGVVHTTTLPKRMSHVNVPDEKVDFLPFAVTRRVLPMLPLWKYPPGSVSFAAVAASLVAPRIDFAVVNVFNAGPG